MSFISEELRMEHSRCRDLLSIYGSIGPTGTSYAATIESELKKADKAVMSGDLAQMIAAHERLKEIKL